MSRACGPVGKGASLIRKRQQVQILPRLRARAITLARAPRRHGCTGWWRAGCVCFKTNSVNAFTGKRTTYDGAADVFMVYSEHTDKVYCVPVSACGSSEVKLRVEPSTGRNNSLIRWAKDFELNGDLTNETV